MTLFGGYFVLLWEDKRRPGTMSRLRSPRNLRDAFWAVVPVPHAVARKFAQGQPNFGLCGQPAIGGVWNWRIDFGQPISGWPIGRYSDVERAHCRDDAQERRRSRKRTDN